MAGILARASRTTAEESAQRNSGAFKSEPCASPNIFTATLLSRYILRVPSSTTNHCPCGSHHHYTACCGKYIDDNIPAPTAEQLMRSRYSAYTRSHSDYLLMSWHPATRPTTLDLRQPPIPKWLGLSICRIEAGSERDSHGIVEFIARYKAAGKTAVIHEISRFAKEEQRWYYVDGTISQSAQNSPCPCGSNKKFKRCCGK